MVFQTASFICPPPSPSWYVVCINPPWFFFCLYYEFVPPPSSCFLQTLPLMQLRENREHVWAWPHTQSIWNPQPPKPFRILEKQTVPERSHFAKCRYWSAANLRGLVKCRTPPPLRPVGPSSGSSGLLTGEMVNPLLQALKPPVRQSRDIY